MRTSAFIRGFLIGGLAGALFILLYTPESGKNIRTQVQDGIQNMRQEISNAAITRRAEMEQELAILRTPQKAPEK